MSVNYTCNGYLDTLCASIAIWRTRKGFSTGWHNVPEKLMLIVTELSEAMEAYRHLDNDMLTHATASTDEHMANFREELADTAIRLFDLTGSLGIELEKEIANKMEVNEGREHKHGKKR